MADCIFCKIINKEIPSKIIYEDDHVLAIHDIEPVAPVHILVMPRKHITGIAAVTDEELSNIGHIYGVIRDIAKKMELNEGYRVVLNHGQQGGQTVNHLHFHLLGGRSMNWPPG
ncbi:MAG: histidine triad nucleotide-binding protein [Firmicutes bacterium HGW-Firmicutes-12]|jgi:histidine triad (HIT) family protein|nr:MAG: histidine triad nucleotide-binding protein [Firmicutes bacterium HGW-Firmicutes-12]